MYNLNLSRDDSENIYIDWLSFYFDNQQKKRNFRYIPDIYYLQTYMRNNWD